MRKIILLLTALLLFTCPAFAEDEEEELTLEEILSDADPEVVADTFISFEELTNFTEAEPVKSIYEEDGSILITITGTGDFTVGVDSRKSSNIWYTELKKQGGDPNFAMKNIRDGCWRMT